MFKSPHLRKTPSVSHAGLRLEVSTVLGDCSQDTTLWSRGLERGLCGVQAGPLGAVLQSFVRRPGLALAVSVSAHRRSLELESSGSEKAGLNGPSSCPRSRGHARGARHASHKTAGPPPGDPRRRSDLARFVDREQPAAPYYTYNRGLLAPIGTYANPPLRGGYLIDPKHRNSRRRTMQGLISRGHQTGRTVSVGTSCSINRRNTAP